MSLLECISEVVLVFLVNYDLPGVAQKAMSASKSCAVGRLSAKASSNCRLSTTPYRETTGNDDLLDEWRSRQRMTKRTIYLQTAGNSERFYWREPSVSSLATAGYGLLETLNYKSDTDNDKHDATYKTNLHG